MGFWASFLVLFVLIGIYAWFEVKKADEKSTDKVCKNCPKSCIGKLGEEDV